MLPADWGSGYPNVWLGTTAENQVEADRRIPILQSVPARVRFLSAEPLLEAIEPDLAGIHWCIIGGESGSLRRPIRSGVDAVAARSVPHGERCGVRQADRW
jgi:protein gp37